MNSATLNQVSIKGSIFRSVTPQTDASGEKTGLTVELENGVRFSSDSFDGSVGVTTPGGEYSKLAGGRPVSMEYTDWNGLKLATKEAELHVLPDGRAWARDLRTAVSMVPIGPAVAAIFGTGTSDYVSRSASMMKGYARQQADSFSITSSDGKALDTVAEANLHGSGRLARALGVEFGLPDPRRKTQDVSLVDGQTIVWNDAGRSNSLTLPVHLEHFNIA